MPAWDPRTAPGPTAAAAVALTARAAVPPGPTDGPMNIHTCTYTHHLQLPTDHMCTCMASQKVKLDRRVWGTGKGWCLAAQTN